MDVGQRVDTIFRCVPTVGIIRNWGTNGRVNGPVLEAGRQWVMGVIVRRWEGRSNESPLVLRSPTLRNKNAVLMFAWAL